MKDLIRSPLQFVRPMTDEEWQTLVLRARHRERLRLKRRQAHGGPKRIELTERRLGPAVTAGACAAYPSTY